MIWIRFKSGKIRHTVDQNAPKALPHGYVARTGCCHQPYSNENVVFADRKDKPCYMAKEEQ